MRIAVATFALLLVFAAGCIIPDIGIVVYATQECGDQFKASTNWASGINGYGAKNFITIDEEPIVHIWCLTPDQSALMEFPDSWIHVQIEQDVVAACHERAIELGLGQTNCAAMATVAYAGTCPGEQAWCEDEASGGDDEVGAPADLPPD